MVLHCNECWRNIPRGSKTVVTACGHCYCFHCARSWEGTFDCKICGEPLDKGSIKITTAQTDTRSSLPLSLYGQSPQTILASALNAIDFSLEQDKLAKRLQVKRMQRRIKEVHQEAKAKLSNMREKLGSILRSIQWNKKARKITEAAIEDLSHKTKQETVRRNQIIQQLQGRGRGGGNRQGDLFNTSSSISPLLAMENQLGVYHSGDGGIQRKQYNRVLPSRDDSSECREPVMKHHRLALPSPLDDRTNDRTNHYRVSQGKGGAGTTSAASLNSLGSSAYLSEGRVEQDRSNKRWYLPGGSVAVSASTAASSRATSISSMGSLQSQASGESGPLARGALVRERVGLPSHRQQETALESINVTHAITRRSSQHIIGDQNRRGLQMMGGTFQEGMNYRGGTSSRGQGSKGGLLDMSDSQGTTHTTNRFYM